MAATAAQAAGQSLVTQVPGVTAVGQQAPTVPVTLTFTATGVAATTQVLTQGVAGLDFAAAGGTCSAGAGYSTGQQCVVQVAFTPRYPGARQGAVVVADAAGNVLAESLVGGVASGSLAVITPGNISTVAGDAAWYYNGDGQQATSANLFLPMGVVADAKGNLFLTDSANYRVRRVDAVSGVITTVAGGSTPGYTGDGGPARNALLSQPAGIAMDGAGNLYIADVGNNVVRRIDAITGIITTVAGNGLQAYSGDGGPATASALNLPEGVALDAAGNLYIADSGNNVVRLVSPNGVITTVAGNGAAGFSGDGGAATSARLNTPWTVAITASGALLIADFNNNRVRKVEGGIIRTFAGVGSTGFSGDGGLASQAELNAPAALALDPAGNVYIGDSANNRVREVLASNGVIQTVAGDGSESYFSTDEGQPSNHVGLYGPYALFFDQTGNLLLADMLHNRLRAIRGTATQITYPDMKEGKTSSPVLVTLANDGNADLHFTAAQLTASALDAATTTCLVGSAIGTDQTCQLGVEFAPTVVGSPVTGKLVQPSDAGNSPITITLSGNVLSVNPATLVLTSSANPSVVNAPVTFVAKVKAADAVTGSVVFTDGGATLCTVTLDAGGQALCLANSLSLGSHAITAAYGGDLQNSTAQASLTQLVQQQDTLALTASPNPATVGQNVTLNFVATAPTGVPSGTAKFYDGGSLLGTQPLSSGAASLVVSTFSVGAHSLTVQYSGDDANAAGTSNAVSEVVNAANSSVALSSSAASVTVGTNVLFTAKVTGSSGQTPTGTLTFLDGTTTIGTGSLNGSGTATLATSALTPGTHAITASYGGDSHSSPSTSAVVTETVSQIGTTTALGVNPPSSSAGATIQLTASVAMAAGATANGTITGTVSFTNNGVLLGTSALNASGIATLSTNALNAGTQSLLATYNGSTNYATSTSTAVSETVNQTPTTTAAVATPASPQAGQAVTVTATVSSSTIAPGGTVLFSLGGVTLGTAPLNAAGVATLTTTTLPVGTDALTVSYAGNANYGASAATVTVPVAVATTQTALASSLSPQALGQPVSLTATVSSANPGIGGTVTFQDGGVTLGTAPVNGGVAVFTTTTLTFGTHNLTAVYGGDTNHAASTSGTLSEKIVQSVTAALTSNANPAVSGQSITFTAKLSGAASSAPGGNVVFADGAVTLGTAALDTTGTATFATTTLAVGTHNIAIAYAGDSNYFSAHAALVQTVQSATTQVTLTSSANPATYGAATTFTATVTSAGTPASGVVTFTDGGTTIGSATLNAAGVAIMSTSTLAPGLHSVVASYAGSGSTSASVSTALALKVEQLTTLGLTSSENPAYTLDTLTFTATVTNAGLSEATGTVTFLDGTTPLGSVPLGANGQATLSGITLVSGSHSITATYSGDATDLPATSTALGESVSLRPTSTTLTATNADPTNPQAAALIAVVRWTGAGNTIPTGTVTFSSGGQTLGTGTLNSAGVATLDVILQAASQNITASYAGDTNYAASTSLATSIVSKGATQFSIGVTPPQLSLPSGQHTTVTVTMTSLNGFSDNMQMGCLGLPVYATCTFTNVLPSLSANGTASVQLTVDTGNPLGSGATTASLHQPSEGRGGNAIAFAILPAGVLLGFGLYKRRRLGALLVVVLAVAASLTATGCSGLHQATTPAGAYSFKVVAVGKGTGATESTAVTLTVTGN